MKVDLVFVPPGGGEADYMLGFELPAMPQPGDYISVSRKGGEVGQEDFIVRRIWWSLEFPNNLLSETAENRSFGKPTSICVECEFARGPFSTEAHKSACDAYEARGFKVQTHEASAN